MKKFTIIEHHPIDSEDCGGDYEKISVYLDDKLVAEYGDYYHDKGDEKAKAFIDGYRAASDETISDKVEYQAINDWER